MSKDISITLTNIPDSVLNQAWVDCKTDAMEMVGVAPITETRDIKIDFEKLADNYSFCHEHLAQIIASSLTCHVIMEADKILNA